MANTFKFGNGNWAVKDGYALAYNDENNNFKPLPFDFTRASSATTLNRQGLVETVPSGKPRIDFLDNTDGHLLLEPSRTNIVFYSEQLDNSVWNKLTNTTVTANQTLSPDGSQNADEFSATSTSTSLMAVQDSFSVSSSVDYVISFFAKKGSVRYVQLFNGTGQVTGNPRTNFDLQDGNIAIQDSGHTSSIEDFGNGWYRCTTKVTTLSTTLQMYINGVSTSTASRSATSSWTSGNNFYVWGAQFEAGSYATSYIPTEGSSVTRAVETTNATLNSSVLSNLEGTILIDVDYVSTSDVVVLASPHDGSTNKRVEIWANGSVINGFIGGSVNIAIGNTTISNGRNKIALAYKSGDSAFYVNGSQIGVSSISFTISSLTKFSFNSFSSASTAFQNVNQAKIYNTRLSNTELQNLTS